ncbi:MAG: hypothetical protein QOH41_1426 [Blastocatellia bacterium]|jgi:small-conductance mechanosensitive channel|nr:hypothetical protein [Blastocatellia bacterium]
MKESVLWQICFVFSLVGIGIEAIAANASLPAYYKKVRSNIVNFFLFIFLSSSSLATLTLLLRKESKPYVVIGVAITSLCLMLFVIIWLVPSKQRKAKKGKPSHVAPGAKWLIPKVFYSAILFVSPVLLVTHVYTNRDYYTSNLDAYNAFLTPTPTPTPAQSPTLTSLPTPMPIPTPMALSKPQATSNPAPVSNGLSRYASAMELHFLMNTKMLCAQSDTNCLRLQNLILGTQNNRLLFLAKVIYYFLCLYLILNYYGRLLELRHKHRPKGAGDLGLESDVIEQCSHIVSVSVAFLLALVLVGVDFSSLGVFAGLIGAGLSVAMKDILENVVAGVLLLWGQTIKAKDVITIPRSESSDTGATYGVVKRMTMRYTIVEDRNEVRRLIPNSKLTNSTIENWTHEENAVRLRVMVDVDYDTDLRMARRILESICYEVPKIDTKKQAPKAVVTGFGDSAIHFSLRFWINDPDKGIRPILSDLYIAISERFKEEGIKIPYPRRDLRMIPRDTRRNQEDQQDMNRILVASD